MLKKYSIPPILLLVLLLAEQTACSQNLLRIRENGLWGYINYKGEVVIKPKYHVAGNFNYGLAPVREGGQYGFVDSTGNYVIPPQYDFAEDFSDSIAIVGLNGIFNYINLNNQKLLEDGRNFSKLFRFSSGAAVVWTTVRPYFNVKAGIINRVGSFIADTAYEIIGGFTNGAAIVESWHDPNLKVQSNNYGLIDTLGNFIIPLGKYRQIDYFQNGYARVPIDDSTMGFIDTKGNLISKVDLKKYLFAGGPIEVSNGMIKLYLYKKKFDVNKESYNSSDMHTAFMNFEGEILINNPEYKSVNNFTCGRAFVSTNDYKSWFIIDKHGNKVGNKTFNGRNNNYYFHNGICIVEKDGYYGVIDTNANFLIPPNYKGLEAVYSSNELIFFSGEKGKPQNGWGLMNLNGEILFTPRFDDFDRKGFQNGILKVFEDGKIGYIDINGNYIWRGGNLDEEDQTYLNIDYRYNEHYAGFTNAQKEKYYNEGFVYPEEIPNEMQFLNGKISLIIKESEKCTFNKKFKGFSLYVVNATNKKVLIPSLENRLYLILEAKDPDGSWRAIEDYPGVTIDEINYDVKFEAKNYWKFSIPMFQGEFNTKIRASLKVRDGAGKENTIYSNEISGSVNPGQFWRSIAWFNYDNEFFNKY